MMCILFSGYKYYMLLYIITYKTSPLYDPKDVQIP